ncbi:family 16 glycosylhydrolase [Thalassotalea piscium]
MPSLPSHELSLQMLYQKALPTICTTFSLMLLSSCASTSQQPSSFTPLIESPTRGDWQYVSQLSDEFNADKINLQKWTNDPNDWGPWSWDQKNTQVKDGNLNISLTYEEHTAKRWSGHKEKVDVNLFYKSGILRSHHYQTYGYYEVRMKGIPTFPGSSPAFWIYSLNEEINTMGLKTSEEGKPTYSEVDIVELQQSEWIEGSYKKYDGANVIDMNLHTRVIENGKEVWKRPGKYPELTRNKIQADFDARDDFHVYGAEVSEEKVTWYIDGKKVAEKPNIYWHLPMHVTLSLGLRRPHVTYNNCPDGLARCAVPEEATAKGYPSAMQVDWVRVYKKR